MNEDNVFCHEIAKRSVARAALHLGVDSMSEDALDAMGDVLLAYLERMGRALSTLVETSGRSSAHVNVLDAFRAVEATTSPAVHQLHMNPEERRTAAGFNGWQDLAEFCFGPDWLKQQQEQEEPKQPPQEAQPGQGKVMASPSGENGDAPVAKKKGGWEAPYLDEVPTFPQTVSLTVANPHRLPSNVTLSLHQTDEEMSKSKKDVAQQAEQEAERELQGVPDDVFTTPWGAAAANDSSSSLNSRKRKAEPSDKDAKEDEEETGSPPIKRTKLNEEQEIAVTSKQAPRTITDKVPTQKRPAYVPSFYPLFPQPKTARLGRAVMDVEEGAPPKHAQKSSLTTTDDGDSMLGLRSSLVKLGGQHYWGSGWEGKETAASSTTILKVPLGRPEGGGADTPSIVPLGRASGSRVSRILEGSMDAVS